MALSDEDKKEIIQLIRKEMLNASAEVFNQFVNRKYDTESERQLRQTAITISDVARDEIYKKYQLTW